MDRCEQRQKYKHEWYLRNKERHAALAHQRYLRDIEVKKQYDRGRYQDNKDKVLAKHRAYRRANAARLNARARERCANTLAKRIARVEAKKRWLQKPGNREKVRAQARLYYRTLTREYITQRNHKRRARIIGAGGSFSRQDIALMRKRQANRCYWCSVKLSQYHIDHVWPLVSGGSNGVENICLACPDCNYRKGQKSPIQFAGRLF